MFYILLTLASACFRVDGIAQCGGRVEQWLETLARGQQLLFPFPVHRLAGLHPKQQSKGTNHWRIVRELIVRMKIKIGCMDKQNSLKYKFKHSDVLYYVPDNSQVTQDAKNKASK